MWTVSAIQHHARAAICCDEDSTMELRVKTVKYFKGLMDTANLLGGGSPMLGYRSSSGGASPKASKRARAE